MDDLRERLMRGVFLALAMVSVACVALITLYLVTSGVPALVAIGPREFLAGGVWAPTRTPPVYGIAPFIAASVLGTLGAVALGVPVGLLAALWLAKMAPRPLARALGGVVGFLAAIPSVVYGLVAMLTLVPAIRAAFGLPDGSGLLAAVIVLAVMILPSIIKVSVAALEAVPREYEDGSLALGATPVETYLRVSVPAARSGLAAAVVLGVGRALGEAMAVIMVAGNAPNLPDLLGPGCGLFESVRFLTTAIASEMAYADGLHRQALFSIALVLYVFILLINAALNLCLKKGRASR